MVPRYLRIKDYLLLEIPIPITKGVRTVDIKQYRKDFSIEEIFSIFIFINDTNTEWMRFKENHEGTIPIYNKDIHKIYITALVAKRYKLDSKIKATKIEGCDSDEIFIKMQYVNCSICIDEDLAYHAHRLLVFGLKDKFLYRLSLGAYAREDKLLACNQFKYAIETPKGRYLEGAFKGIMGATNNSMCIISLLYFLMKNPNVYYFPYHPKGWYIWPDVHRYTDNRQFTPAPDTKIRLADLRWDHTTASLYIDIIVGGSVNLEMRNTDYIAANLPKIINTYTHQRIHFIAKGKPVHVKRYLELPSSLEYQFSETGIFRDEHGAYLDTSMFPLFYCGCNELLENRYERLFAHECKLYFMKYAKKLRGHYAIPKCISDFNEYYATLNEEQINILGRSRIHNSGFRYIEPKAEDTKVFFAVPDPVTDMRELKDLAYFTGDPFVTQRIIAPEKVKNFMESINFYDAYTDEKLDECIRREEVELAESIYFVERRFLNTLHQHAKYFDGKTEGVFSIPFFETLENDLYRAREKARKAIK